MKLKILQIVYAFYPPYSESGNSRVASEISKALALRGHDVTVYTTNVLSRDKMFNLKKQVCNIHNVKVHYCKNILYKPYLPIPLFFSKDLLSKIKDSLMKYDIVHIHEYRFYTSPLIYFYAKRFRIPYIVQAHGELPRIGPKRSLKWLFDVLFGYKLLRDASKVIALSRFEAEQYKSMGVPEEKIAIIPNGIDLSEYANLPPKGAFKRKFGIPEEKKVILYLGRIHKIKGIDFLIKAYTHLINDRHCKDALLVIAGPDDGYLKEAKSLTSALSISKHVLFTGPLYGRDKLEAYVDSDVVVLPSRYETFPMAVLEAYACGKPVIASKVGGLEDLIINGETGLLFEAGNIKRLTRSIFNLINSNNMAKEMGLKSKTFVRENFTIEKVVERLEKIYEEVFKNRCYEGYGFS
ncbi:TPA: glycosyltransferase [Candidatus Poribacteria bacterium]|nr:glycosyltransferase [Candidatus Poribacteria bacterium]